MKVQDIGTIQKQIPKISVKEYTSKLKDTYNSMDRILYTGEEMETSREEQIKLIEAILKECISNNDFNKALAVFNYVSCITDIPLSMLNLKNLEDNNSVIHVALENDSVEEFTNLILAGEVLGYFNQTE